MPHAVALENTFVGPLDLLLYLVRREEIDIHQVPVARLTGDYMSVLSQTRFSDLDQAGDFLALAAMLAEIKSRSLLPPSETAGDVSEEDEPSDPR